MDASPEKMIYAETKGVKNIIFDMDGTLVDSAKASITACQKSASKLGLEVKPKDVITGLIGWANPVFYQKLYPGISSDILEEYALAVEKMERQCMRELGVEMLFPQVQELLEVLMREGCFLSIASTGDRQHVQTALMETGILPYFSVIRCNEAEKESMVREIVQNGPEGKWLMVGDRDKDLKAARANGIVAVAAEYGYGTREECKQFDTGIAQPVALLDLLGITK